MCNLIIISMSKMSKTVFVMPSGGTLRFRVSDEDTEPSLQRFNI